TPTEGLRLRGPAGRGARAHLEAGRSAHGRGLLLQRIQNSFLASPTRSLSPDTSIRHTAHEKVLPQPLLNIRPIKSGTPKPTMSRFPPRGFRGEGSGAPVGGRASILKIAPTPPSKGRPSVTRSEEHTSEL